MIHDHIFSFAVPIGISCFLSGSFILEPIRERVEKIFSDKDRWGGDYLFHMVNLREWVTVEIDGVPIQCSDFLKWHSQEYLKPKDANDLTRGKNEQKLGGGWIGIRDLYGPPIPAPD